MVWKSWDPNTWMRSTRTPPVTHTRQEGGLIALVRDHVERLPSITPDALSFNLTDGRALIRYPQNDAAFDLYIGLPFTKGVTERGTGRTQLILGTSAHHIDAMIGQFVHAQRFAANVSYGDCIRWINVGGRRDGFIGLEYAPWSRIHDGVARTPGDVQFLATTLLASGFDARKQLFLLDPPYLNETPLGKAIREGGVHDLQGFARLDPQDPLWCAPRTRQHPY